MLGDENQNPSIFFNLARIYTPEASLTGYKAGTSIHILINMDCYFDIMLHIDVDVNLKVWEYTLNYSTSLEMLAVFFIHLLPFGQDTRQKLFRRLV